MNNGRARKHPNSWENFINWKSTKPERNIETARDKLKNTLFELIHEKAQNSERNIERNQFACLTEIP